MVLGKYNISNNMHHNIQLDMSCKWLWNGRSDLFERIRKEPKKE